jgi:hypothetical protein
MSVSAAAAGSTECRAVSPALEPLVLGLNHPSEKKSLKIKELEPVPIGKAGQLFRNMLSRGMSKSVSGFAPAPTH